MRPGGLSAQGAQAPPEGEAEEAAQQPELPADHVEIEKSNVLILVGWLT